MTQFIVTYSPNGFDEDRHLIPSIAFGTIEEARTYITTDATLRYGKDSTVRFTNSNKEYEEYEALLATKDPEYEKRSFEEAMDDLFYQCCYYIDTGAGVHEEGWFVPTGMFEEAFVEGGSANGYRYYTIQTLD